jgi:hypothetical protein
MLSAANGKKQEKSAANGKNRKILPAAIAAATRKAGMGSGALFEELGDLEVGDLLHFLE